MKIQRGFVSAVVLIAMVLGLLVAGGGAYYVVHQQSSSPTLSNNTFDNSQTSQSTQTTTAFPNQNATNIAITYPANGDTLRQDQKATVKWNVPRSILDTVPSDFDAYVFIYASRQNDGQGVPNSSSVGGGSPATDGAAVWDIAHARWDSSGKYAVALDLGTYDMHARFQVEPKDHNRLCAKTVNHECVPDDATAAVLQKFANIESKKVTFQIAAAGSANVSVSGMSKYTDSDFGFSFWYPSRWTIENAPADRAMSFGKTGDYSVNGVLIARPSVGSSYWIQINEYTGNSMYVPAGCAKFTCYSSLLWFDANDHVWMQQYLDADSESGRYQNSPPSTADVSTNTMGGLHIIGSSIVPLSAHKFLYVTVINGTGESHVPLLKTIVATDPSVATPISNAEQTATIQAAARTYSN